MRILPSISLAAIAVVAASCAQGGKTTSLKQEVKFAANHHVFSFRTRPGFGTVPVDPTDVFTTSGLMALDAQSNYSITTAGGTVRGIYALANNGSFTVVDPGNGRTGSLNYPGAYGLVGDDKHFVFVDGYSTTGSPSLGLWYGTQTMAISTVSPQPTGTVPPPQLDGDWHLFALHTVVGVSTPAAPGSVGRATRGSISIAAAATPGALQTISGTATGFESTGTSITFAGSLQLLITGDAGDGRINLGLSWQNALFPGTPGDDRTFLAAAGQDVVFGLDDTTTDGEAGMLFLLRKHDSGTPATRSAVAGEYLVGGHTLFVNPANAGSDSMVGRLSLTDQGAFRFTLVGSNNADFSISGTYTVDAAGLLDLNVASTNEHWFGATNPAHNSIVVLDSTIETRTSGNSELNLWLGVREKPSTP